VLLAIRWSNASGSNSPPTPLQVLNRFIAVLAIEDGVKKGVISTDDAHVFRWSGAFAIKDRRTVHALGAFFDGLDLHDMPPVVAEVVEIDEFLDRVDEMLQFRLAVVKQRQVDLLDVIEHVFIVEHLVLGVFDGKLMQVRIGPAKGCLENVMQQAQRHVAIDDDAAPYWRLDAVDMDVQGNDFAGLGNGARR